MGIERWFRRLTMRLRSLLSGRRLDRELDEELRYHLERQVDANVARGLSPAQARREALLAIGGVEQRKEECRDTRRVRLVGDLLQDLRYAGRTLHRSPAFTIAAILTLTLGIGTTVAMFTVVNGVLLRPMPFPQPDQLFLVSLAPRGPFMRQPALADHHYVAFRASNRAFGQLAAFATYRGNLIGAGDPAVITVGSVTPEFFSALQVPPAAGRTFLPGDDQPDRRRIVVLSERLWRGRFGSDPAIVGKDVTLDGVRHAVVGVMPSGFDFPNRAEAWTPKDMRLDPGMSLMYPVLGRLKPDVTVEQARAQFDTFMHQLPDPPGAEAKDWLVGILPLKDLLVADIRRSLQIFAGAVMFVLLIACANVANLLLARASGREREIAVRAALGAGRARLIRQLLTESTLLALAGGALGILAARWGVPALLALAPRGRIPRLEMIVVDRSVLAFAIGVSLLTGIVFGLAPALRLTRRRFAGSLLPGGRMLQGGQERLRAALVVGEIALALTLLTGAGLMLKSFLRLRAVDPGFRPDHVVTLTVNLPGSTYSTVQKVHAFQHDTLARLSSLPDVVVAGAVNWRPLGGQHMNGDFQVDGPSALPVNFNVDKPTVSPGYLGAMGITLLRGRDFKDSDDAAGAGVAIVSRSVARALSESEDVIGKRVTLESRPAPADWLTIVGVVNDVKQLGPALPSHPAIYRPYPQVQRPSLLRHMNFVVRTATDPVRVLPSIRGALRAVDKDQPAASIALMADVLGAATAEPGFHMRLLGTFAMVALVLALVGTYGMLAYSVALRTHEIGLRMALGARPGAVLWMVIRRTLALGAAGIVIGIAGALFATRILASLLFEITPTDPATFGAVALTILVAALAAGFIPARRATRVDPLVALRHE
jgi:putative ABC transport system permease protein